MRENGKELEENIGNVEYVYKYGVDTIPLQTCILLLSKALLFYFKAYEVIL